MTRFIVTVFSMAVFSTSVMAAVEKEYDPARPMLTTPWFSSMSEEGRQADLAFVRGMRPHHAGALTMSEKYLSDDAASHPTLKQLARGIIHNQTFEIGVLDMAGQYAQKGDGQIAAEGQAQVQRFQRAPMPAAWGISAQDERVSARDVQFAKAMIIHHQAAVDMCAAYNRDPAVNNQYLKKICLDVMVDQEQEISLMNKIISAYTGDAQAVQITPDMVHGMEGMAHASHNGHGASHAHH